MVGAGNQGVVALGLRTELNQAQTNHSSKTEKRGWCGLLTIASGVSGFCPQPVYAAVWAMLSSDVPAHGSR